MDQNFDLRSYVLRGGERVAAEVMRATWKNPRESAFLLRFGASFAASTKRRHDARATGKKVPGYLTLRLGLRHAFAGAEPKLRFNYAGDGANAYDLREAQDKTHFVCSLGGEARFAHGWSVAGEAGLTRGAHDKEWSCALTVRKSW